MKAILGDITILEVDAIVNAANNAMLGGKGVDGAIHAAAGIELLEECKTFNVIDNVRCQTGDAQITKGYKLKAKYVIHTVGPIYWHYTPEEAEVLLRNCYKNVLKVAEANNVKSIAFPAISCGVYGYPLEDAAKIAIEECSKSNIEITFACFPESVFNVYSETLSKI